MTLKRLILLVLAIALVAAPIAESAVSDAPVAGSAKKKKAKCKKKGKKGKKGKKCKKKKGTGGGAGGLPGKPVSPTPGDPDDPDSLLLSGLSLDENPLLAGESGEGQVTIGAPAPAGGQAVTLSSGIPGRAGVPDGVHIAAGQTSANFPITTTAGPNETVTLTAATPSSIRTADLQIVEEESLLGLALDYQCFPDDNLDDFGASTVSLDVKAPDNVSVSLQSDAPTFLAVPPTVIVPDGQFTGAFSVDTFQMTSSPVTVTATYDGEQVTDTATIRDSATSPNPVPSTLGLSPNSVVVGDPSTGTVNLDCEAPPGGIVVTLGSDHPNAHVPVSVVVPEGDLGATFPITTDLSGTPGQAHISATATGLGTPIEATLTLRAIGT
jgi:trimeric autotransporter adhesin